MTLFHSYPVIDSRTGRIVALYAFREMALRNCGPGQYVPKQAIVTGRRH